MTGWFGGWRGNWLPRVFCGALIFLFLSCGSSPPGTPEPAGHAWVARCGDQVVEVQEFQAYVDQQTGRNPRLRLTPALKRDLLEKYLEKKLLLAEANRQGLIHQPEVSKELEEMQEQILLKHLFARQQKELAGQVKISEAEIQKYYQEMNQGFRFRYVLAADPDQAGNILADWTKKRPPAEPVDSGEVSLAALSETWKREIPRLPLKKPQIVRIGGEWLVVEVVKKGPEAIPPLNQVREHIVQELTHRQEKARLQNWVNRLKGQAKLEINEAYPWR